MNRSALERSESAEPAVLESTKTKMKPSQSASEPHAQVEKNRQARERALPQVSPAINLAAAGVTFESQGRLLILGAEHRIRLAASRLVEQGSLLSSMVGLVTEAMPAQIDAEMEAAAGAVPDLNLYRLPLSRLRGYLGQFDVQIELDTSEGVVSQSLAKLALGVEMFDLVLDLGAQSQLSAALKPAGYFAPQNAQQLSQALLEIPGLKGGFDKPQYFKVHSDLCALSGSNMTGCTRCLDVCPADAISVAAGVVQIDAHLCHGAGGCASACPTSAIRYGFPQPGLLLDALQRLIRVYRAAGGDAPSLLLHDAAFAEVGLGDLLPQLPGQMLPLQVEETGSAGMEVWLSAIALGATEVNLLHDANLPESIALLLTTEIETANRMLQGLQLAARVALVTVEQLLASVESQTTAVDATSPLSVPVVDSISPIAQLALQADKRAQISQAMSHLYQQVAEQYAPEQHTSPELPTEVLLSRGAAFGRVDVKTEDCTLCMACVAICPTKALKSNPDTPQLSFVEDACVQCGLCTQACPESVLSLTARYQLDPALRTQPRLLKEEQPFCCISCGEPFATQSVVTLMLKKLTGHSMFDADGLRRLEMCADCRVVDIVRTDPGGDLFAMAKGRPAEETEINLAQVEAKTNADEVAS